MKTIAIAMALLMMMGGATAFSQGGTPGPGATKGSGIPPAPIGHRQPRASDVPSEKNLANPNDPLVKEDAILDKKIKSICRGC